MKVFEVITEHYPSNSNEITTERQYVTSEDDSMKLVVDHFTRHCYEYEKELKSVREVITITQKIH